MKLPFRLDDKVGSRLGFAPGAVALPTPRDDVVFAVGLSTDFSRVFATTEAYRVQSGRLIPAGLKTYNLVGPINAVDINLPGMRVYVERLCDANKNTIDETSIRRILGKPLDEFRQLCTRVIGRDFLNGNMVPGEMRIINKALEFLSKRKLDHARLFLQWPGFCQTFLEFPDIIDRSVAGESMWDLMPHGFDEASVRELRKIRKFSTAWVDSGVPSDVYLKTLAKACTYLPDGAQRPEDKTEARSLIHMHELCDQAFRSLEPTMQAKVKRALFSHGDTWRGPSEGFAAEYAYDYIHYVYYNLLLDAFRLNGIHSPSEEMRVRAFFGIVGGSLQRVAQSSKQWHARLPAIMSARDPSVPNSWVSAIDLIHVPAFRTVEMDHNEEVTNVYIFPLDNDEELAKEGNGQRHCVYSQKRLCAEGSLRVVSIRQMIDQEFKTLSTASFYLQDGFLYVRDHRAFANADPSYVSREALGWFEGQINGLRPSFRFNREWSPAVKTQETTENLRAALHDRFEKCRPALSKKMQKGGFDALVAECA
ncbi:hypothetical protein HFO56_23860 [Rhizobium laguerreae]|uniref:PcfJ domain-containing protein n=1 Tax=Rhizobium laguerreae TaxID=1076926 RepID=UPI001C90064E|nr:PcfJ domain-containing protein [Rhizobium laguerreae]MBY3155364.1 hypothetical protein [Rhizobium laguerreae]